MTKKEKTNTMAKAALIGAAVVAGGAAVVALNDEKTRNQIGKVIDDVKEKGAALSEMAQKLPNSRPEAKKMINKEIAKHTRSTQA